MDLNGFYERVKISFGLLILYITPIVFTVSFRTY
jgi:hypothetical protein